MEHPALCTGWLWQWCLPFCYIRWQYGGFVMIDNLFFWKCRCCYELKSWNMACFVHTFFFLNYSSSAAFGEGTGTPLQYSCLENPMDRGAWWAAVHGVAKSRTWLSDFTFTFHFHALEKEMATHSSVLAWRILGMGEPGGLPSMGSHRVGHDWSSLAAAAFHYTDGPHLVHLFASWWTFGLFPVFACYE